MEAAGAVDAQNAPTAPWKTTEPFSTSSHRRPRLHSEGDISNESSAGTFLTSVDKGLLLILTHPGFHVRVANRVFNPGSHLTRSPVSFSSRTLWSSQP